MIATRTYWLLHGVVACLLLLGACKRRVAETSTVDAGGSRAVAAPAPTRATHPIAASPDRPREGSAVVLAGDVGYLADEDAHAIVTFNPNDPAAARTQTKLGGRPGQLLVTSDGLLAAALRDEHAIAFFGRADDGGLIEERRVAVADEPVALARVPSGDGLVAVCAIGHALCVVDGTAAARCFDLARDPRAVTVSDDGSTAIVAHASADGASIVTLASGAVKATPLGRARFRRNLRELESDRLPPNLGADFSIGEIRFARFARQGFAAVRLPGERERIAIPVSLSAPGDRESRGNGYGPGGGSGSTFTFDETMTIFPVIEFDVASLVGPSFDNEMKEAGLLVQGLTDAEARCFLPRAVAAHGTSIFVACVGSGDIQRFDLAKGKRVTAPPTHFALAGATALAIDDRGRLFSFSQHEHSLAVFDDAEHAATKNDKSVAPSRSVSLDSLGAGDAFASDRVRRGRALFHASRDERISKDRRACATCHPDGRDDGLAWATPEGPRQTVFLAGRLDRKAPYGWHAKHATIAIHVKHTLTQLGGTGLPDEALGDIEAFLRALPPPPRASSALSPEAAHGKEIFSSASARCSTCHAESQGFGGLEAENVGSGSIEDTVKEFLVPSLRYVGASAPYYHDGRFATLEQLIVAADGKMGHTKQLSEGDVGALAAFLKTL